MSEPPQPNLPSQHLLSPAQLRVAGYLAGSMSYPQIAEVLCLAPSTVKSHAEAIYRKYKVTSRSNFRVLVSSPSATLVEIHISIHNPTSRNIQTILNLILPTN